MTVTAAQTATRLPQTATRISGRERHRTVIVMISDPRARARVVDALAEEGLASLALATRDLSELEGTTPAALVYDLAPWSAAAVQFLNRLRSAPWRVAELPVLLYVPPRPEAAQLLVEAGRFSLVRGEMQCDGASEGGRIRGAMRQLLRDAPAAGVFQLLMRHLPDLPSDVQRLCRFACEKLAAHDGAELTVSRAAAELGADRRTLERRLRALGLPMPKELLDWTIVVFAAYVAEKKAVHLYASGPFLGLTNERLRRTRRRLRRLPKADGGVDLVLLHLARRFTGTTGDKTRGNRISA